MVKPLLIVGAAVVLGIATAQVDGNAQGGTRP